MPDYREIKERAAPGLLDLDGVHMVAIGAKVTAGERTGQPAIAVFVERKRPLSEVPEEQRVPSEIEGVPTDVVESPPMRALAGIPGIPANTKREDGEEYRPLRGGIRVTRRGADMDGTLGCICTVVGDPKRVIALTNHHVVFKTAPEVSAGEQCGQPAGRSSSTRSCHDIVGKLIDAQCDEFVDIALIQLNPGVRWLAEIEGDGVVTGIRPPLTNEEAQAGTFQIKKRGAMSRLTGGVITHNHGDGNMTNEDGSFHHHYTQALVIQSNPDPETPGATEFALHGDSGSVVRDLAGAVVGIAFAGAGGQAVAFPIQTLLDTFKTRLPAARRIELAVATATTPGDVRTVPAAAMAADEAPALVPLSRQEAREIEDELRTSRQGTWYADLYRRHADETAALVHTHRRVAVVWHRSGAAELFQWIWQAFTNPELRIPEEIQGRPARACLEDLAAALKRNGSPNLTADVGRVLAVLPDVAGLTQREILERLKAV